MVFKRIKLEKTIPYWIPILLAIFQMLQSYFDNPAYYTRIDPEYLCLLNGLNVSVLKFDHIGYIDLPGAPFMMLTGIFLRITHLLLGQGPIFTDVISRPDLYLKSSSALLMIMTTVILIWGGKKIYSQRKDFWGMVLVQSSFFFANVCLHLPTRYMADRMLPVYVFVFAVYAILLVNQDLSNRKFAIYSGIILGIGLITKINFLPILIIPLFLPLTNKDRLMYIGTLAVSSVVSFLPIVDKFQHFKHFILSIVTHDGMYGNGKAQIFNFGKFIEHLELIIKLNPSFAVLFLMVFISIVMMLVKPFRKKENKESLCLLIGFAAATLIEVIMVSKHFKGYYFTPVLAMAGVVAYIIYHFYRSFFQKKILLFNVITLIVFLALIIPNLFVANHTIDTIKRIKDRQLTVDFINQIRKPSDWFFLEPSWQSGPLVENGLMWGISYVAGRNDYYDDFKKVYPRVIAFEGKNRPISQFRCGKADEKEIMESGDDIIMVPRLGIQTKKMIAQLDSLSNKFNTPISIDTIYINPINKDMVLRASHIH